MSMQLKFFFLNKDVIKNEIELTAASIKKEIKTELKNKIFSLKIDSVSRLNRSVLGINVQYVVKNKIQIKTLAMREMLYKHSAVNIKQIVMDTLNEYDLHVDQIHSITSDNGNNMIKTTSLLNEDVDIEEEIESDF